jgi:cell wall-associated NlpC family hydrolase
MSVAPWAIRYIGIPFLKHGRTRDGCDCWGLCCLVYREIFGVELPSWDDAYPEFDDRPVLARTITQGLVAWEPIDLDEARPGDGVVLRVAGQPLHVGLIAATAPPRMLHVEDGINTCLERLDAPRWARRLHGVYRCRALPT